MKKMQKLLIALALCLTSFISVAQQKYAVLVGINNYYDAPGVLHGTVLQGCVNDAVGVKDMLIGRFGFNEANINLLTDSQATKETVIDGLTDILRKCKAGDAVVFYFSGHGVWMTNTALQSINDSIKRGMDQAMVMSNLYADGLGCLLTDAVVKTICDKFVEKKIMLTAIFDCCFSANLAMDIEPALHNAYISPQQQDETEKSIDWNIPYDLPIDWPGYKERLTNEIFNPNGLDSVLQHDSLINADNSTFDTTKSFNLKDALTINDSEKIGRPSELPYSTFLSLAATDDVEKGAEIADESGNYHGAFTKALLEVIKNNPASMPFPEVFSLISAEIKKQFYRQTPAYHAAPVRMKGNLLGIDSVGFKQTLMAKCVANANNHITISAGTDDGLAVDNVLTCTSIPGGVSIKVVMVGKDTSVAAVIKGNGALIKAGDIFKLSDPYTVSPPLVKVYIGGTNLTSAAFNNLFTKKVAPLVKLSNYWDYKNYNVVTDALTTISYNDPLTKPDIAARALIKKQLTNPFLVFLPIPDYITMPLKKLLRKDQNIQLVNSDSAADFTLYLNYVKGGKDSAEGFVFTYDNIKKFSGDVQEPIISFYSPHINIAKLSISGNELNKLIAGLHSMALEMTRVKSSRWLNYYPLR
jgi:hypothetical protein